MQPAVYHDTRGYEETQRRAAKNLRRVSSRRPMIGSIFAAALARIALARSKLRMSASLPVVWFATTTMRTISAIITIWCCRRKVPHACASSVRARCCGQATAPSSTRAIPPYSNINLSRVSRRPSTVFVPSASPDCSMGLGATNGCRWRGSFVAIRAWDGYFRLIDFDAAQCVRRSATSADKCSISTSGGRYRSPRPACEEADSGDFPQ